MRLSISGTLLNWIVNKWSIKYFVFVHEQSVTELISPTACFSVVNVSWPSSRSPLSLAVADTSRVSSQQSNSSRVNYIRRVRVLEHVEGDGRVPQGPLSVLRSHNRFLYFHFASSSLSVLLFFRGNS